MCDKNPTWMNASKEEIAAMSFDDALGIIQRMINLGHATGDFRPREHLTKAMEIIRDAAIKVHEEGKENKND